MGPMVLDVSVALHWAFPDEAGGALDLVALEAARWAGAFSPQVPDLFWYELRNVLLMGERRGRLSAAQVSDFLSEQAYLDLQFCQPEESAMLPLARRHRLSVYDAAYLELALRRHLPLATLDTALAAAARAENVPLIGG